MTTLTPQFKQSFLKVLLPIFFLTLVIGLALQSIQFFLSSQGTSANHRHSMDIQVGNQLPDFSLSPWNGKEIQVSDLKGRILILNFWAAWCGACLEEMPSLVELEKKYRKQGVLVLGINLDDNPESVVPKILKKYGIQFPVFKDTEGKISELLNVHAIPLTVVLNQDRKILLIQNGSQNWNSHHFHLELERWLSE